MDSVKILTKNINKRFGSINYKRQKIPYSLPSPSRSCKPLCGDLPSMGFAWWLTPVGSLWGTLATPFAGGLVVLVGLGRVVGGLEAPFGGPHGLCGATMGSPCLWVDLPRGARCGTRDKVSVVYHDVSQGYGASCWKVIGDRPPPPQTEHGRWFGRAKTAGPW